MRSSTPKWLSKRSSGFNQTFVKSLSCVFGVSWDLPRLPV